MILAGNPVAADATSEITTMVRAAGAAVLANRLDQALADDVSLLALTIDERAIILAALENPPDAVRSGLLRVPAQLGQRRTR